MVQEFTIYPTRLYINDISQAAVVTDPAQLPIIVGGDTALQDADGDASYVQLSVPQSIYMEFDPYTDFDPNTTDTVSVEVITTAVKSGGIDGIAGWVLTWHEPGGDNFSGGIGDLNMTNETYQQLTAIPESGSGIDVLLQNIYDGTWTTRYPDDGGDLAGHIMYGCNLQNVTNRNIGDDAPISFTQFALHVSIGDVVDPTGPELPNIDTNLVASLDGVRQTFTNN
jgi:hypothetical protein